MNICAMFTVRPMGVRLYGSSNKMGSREIRQNFIKTICKTLLQWLFLVPLKGGRYCR